MLINYVCLNILYIDLTVSDSPSYTYVGEIFETQMQNAYQLRQMMPDIMNIVSPSISRMRSVVDRDWERSYQEIYKMMPDLYPEVRDWCTSHQQWCWIYTHTSRT